MPEIKIAAVLVRKAGAIRAIRLGPRGSRWETHLDAGRHQCEGQVSRGGSRYVRLRSEGGNLYLVSERHLKY
jgi:hypothetical protein